MLHSSNASIKVESILEKYMNPSKIIFVDEVQDGTFENFLDGNINNSIKFICSLGRYPEELKASNLKSTLLCGAHTLKLLSVYTDKKTRSHMRQLSLLINWASASHLILLTVKIPQKQCSKLKRYVHYTKFYISFIDVIINNVVI
jgi:hypothetical protein